MSGNINPMEIIKLLQYGNNPKQVVMNIVQQRSQNNPILNNAMQLAQKGNTTALQQIARNLAQQKGLDFDTEFTKFKSYF